MRAKVRRLLRGRPVVGLVGSLTIHLLLLGAVLFFGPPSAIYVVKRGETLFVELPQTEERAPRGSPAARDRAAPSPAPAVKTPPPKVASPPAPPAETPAKPLPRPSRAPEAEKPPPAPERAASVVPPEAPAPAPQPKPAAPAPDASTAQQGKPAAPAAREPAEGGGQKVAMAPGAPAGPPPVPDIREALRRGGAGGRDDGRGGIEGEPIPLDSIDPKYGDYLDRVRRMIKDKWGFPCVKNASTRQCEYKSGQLVIEFGIMKDGRVPFVNVLRSSGFPIMDDYAVNAVKFASPFPPVPDALGRKGIPILATFNYIVDTSLVNLLR